MDAKLVGVNIYHLAGDGVSAVFSRENPDELELVYGDAQGERKFTGRAVYREDTTPGFLVSVVLEQVPDLHTVTFSLVVPPANRPADLKSVAVKTFAVRTTALTSIAGPDIIEGQLQTHALYALEGNAW
jgi:hypothetical protein